MKQYTTFLANASKLNQLLNHQLSALAIMARTSRKSRQYKDALNKKNSTVNQKASNTQRFNTFKRNNARWGSANKLF